MRTKKKHVAPTNTPDETVHPVGRERYIPVDVERYNGDLPSQEPVDWFIQSDELEEMPVAYGRDGGS